MDNRAILLYCNGLTEQNSDLLGFIILCDDKPIPTGKSAQQCLFMDMPSDNAPEILLNFICSHNSGKFDCNIDNDGTNLILQITANENCVFVKLTNNQGLWHLQTPNDTSPKAYCELTTY